MSSFDEAIADFEKVLASDIYCGVLGQLNTDNLRRDLLTIKTRKESQEIKFQGDALFYQEDLDGALAKYEEALEKDPFNEYAIANIGAIYMMKGDHAQSIDYCTQAIEIIDQFQNETKSFNKQNALEMKLLMRRQKAYSAQQEYEKCKADLDRVIMMEPAHTEAQQSLKIV